MKNINFLLKSLLYIGGFTIIVACSKTTDTNTSSDDIKSYGQTKSVESSTLRVDIQTEPPILDPQVTQDANSARVVNDLFSGLVDFDQKNQPIAGMAKSWDVSSDGKTYTFHLRDGLKFSDGSPITAKDFVYSWQRGANPKTAAPYGYIFEIIQNGGAIIKGLLSVDKLGVIAIDDKTLQVNLSNSNPSFIAILANLPIFSVVSKAAIDRAQKDNKDWLDPNYIVTSGAYTMKEHVIKGYIWAVKNQYYYDADHVLIDNVRYFPIEDTNSSVSMFQSNNLDMTWTVPIDQIKKLKSQYPNEFKQVGEDATYYYSFNMLNPTFGKNPDLRKALSMAVDRDALTTNVIPYQVPLYSFVTSTINAGAFKDLKVSWASLSRDEQIKKAKELYASAGYSTSNPLKITIKYDTKDENKKVALAVASMWSNVLGVKAVIENQDWKTFLADRQKGNYEVARNGWFADYADVSTYTPILSCGNPQNDTKYCNSDYDNYIKKVNTTNNRDMQLDYYKKALTIAIEDSPFIPLYQRSYFRLVSNRVVGYDIQYNSLDRVQSKWFSLR